MIYVSHRLNDFIRGRTYHINDFVMWLSNANNRRFHAVSAAQLCITPEEYIVENAATHTTHTHNPIKKKRNTKDAWVQETRTSETKLAVLEERDKLCNTMAMSPKKILRKRPGSRSAGAFAILLP